MGRILRWTPLGLSAALFVLVGIAALRPVVFDSRQEVFEIPRGTWARRMAGDEVEILPSRIYLVLELRDILLLRNLDDVPQIFGPTLIMPGQSFSLPFSEVSENQFTCTAHASGEMTVIVDEAPTSPWTRLKWRSRRLARAVSRLWGEKAA